LSSLSSFSLSHRFRCLIFFLVSLVVFFVIYNYRLSDCII
jgi:hypothetical protein